MTYIDNIITYFILIQVSCGWIFVSKIQEFSSEPPQYMAMERSFFIILRDDYLRTLFKIVGLVKIKNDISTHES